MTMINVIELKWNGPCSTDHIGHGLWVNKTKISIHLPIFKKSFDIITEYKETKMETLAENFYVEYYSDEGIERMSYLYCALNDLVFNESKYIGSNKNKFYTTIQAK